MTHEEFNKLVDELDGESLNTLKTKNAKYAPCDDALRNFHVGAEIMGTTTGECVWGYATKHISSLRDRIHNNKWDDLDDVKEKIQDTINYLRFLWCVANEEHNMMELFNATEQNNDDNNNTTEQNNDDNNEDDEDYPVDCSFCKYEELIYDDNNWAKGMNTMIVEPCASCKNNFVPNTDEYEEHDNNFVSRVLSRNNK